MTLDQLIDRYCEAWSVSDASVRMSLLRETCTPEITYVDPNQEARSVEALDRLIAKVTALRPGAAVIRTTEVQAHHGLARFGWAVRLADGSLRGGGIDVVEIAPDGSRLTRIVGFFGDLRPLL